MSKEVNITVRAVRRTEPELRKLARALIQLALDRRTKSTSQPLDQAREEQSA